MNPDILKVMPLEISLTGPFEGKMYTSFTLVNDSHLNQCFKIKSTNPNRITVEPNMGFIRGFDRIEVRFYTFSFLTLEIRCMRYLRIRHKKPEIILHNKRENGGDLVTFSKFGKESAKR